MSHSTTHLTSGRERNKVLAAVVVGTTIEWYDFFIYAFMANLVFAQLFFEPAGPGLGQIISLVTIGISFLFRPLGAFLAGHFGDKLGRRPMLVITLLLMGAATTLVGALPTYDQIGILAPILLMLLRILQGLSAGGEWGGAVLMAIEHSPRHRRGLFGSFVQSGVPLGMLLASGTIGFAAVGTLFAAMLGRARSRDVLLPVVLYPITIPVIIAGVQGTSAVAQTVPDEPMAVFWLMLLVSFDVVFVTLALWTFDPLMTD